jgi:hypothetical protein
VYKVNRSSVNCVFDLPIQDAIYGCNKEQVMNSTDFVREQKRLLHVANTYARAYFGHDGHNTQVTARLGPCTNEHFVVLAFIKDSDGSFVEETLGIPWLLASDTLKETALIEQASIDADNARYVV